MNNHPAPAAPPLSRMGDVGARFDRRVTIGSLWVVTNRTERYVAVVMDFDNTRVKIRRVDMPNVTATPTFALWSSFARYEPWTGAA